MDTWTPLGALIISIILLPAVGGLWLTKSDNNTMEAKFDAINEALDGIEKEHDHLRQWLTTHEASDNAAFKETREGLSKLSEQLQHNFELLMLELRKSPNGRSH